MNSYLKRGALIAALSVLALTTTACSSGEANAKPKEAAAEQAPARDTKEGAGKTPGLTAEELAAHRTLAACMTQNGVAVKEPKVGEPFDSSGMNAAFADDRTAFDKVLANCPDYKRLVVGVG